MNYEKITFPEKYNPENRPVFVRNEILINASQETIWSWLTYVTSWPQWYENSSNIETLNQIDDYLTPETRFKWRTFKTNITSEIKEFEPYTRLSWEAKGFGLKAYHGWLIIPIENGCKVITEETQYGLLPSLGRSFIKKGLLEQHQKWLEGLKMKSEGLDIH
jgi:hypothetical protein